MGQILYLAILESKFSKFLKDFIFYHAGLHSSIITLKRYIRMFLKDYFENQYFWCPSGTKILARPFIKTFRRNFRQRVFLLASFPGASFPVGEHWRVFRSEFSQTLCTSVINISSFTECIIKLNLQTSRVIISNVLTVE